MMKNRKSASPLLPVTAADGSGEPAGASPMSGSHNNSNTATTRRTKRSLLLSSQPTPAGAGGEMLSFFRFLTILVACGFCVVFVLRSAVATAARQPPQLSSSGAEDGNDPDSEFVHKKPPVAAAAASPQGVAFDQQQLLLQEDQEAAARSLQNGSSPLDEFATLSAQLASHDIVALYFAASWCPMSTPVTDLLDDLFREKLLSNKKTNPAVNKDNNNSDFTVLYVSSDRDEASFRNYLKPGWEAVPFADRDQRARLKRHFRTCAKREMADLELARRDGELPAVIVLDGRAARSSSKNSNNNNNNNSQVVLTKHGIRDMKEMGAGALDHWKELQRLAGALDSKYYATADMR